MEPERMEPETSRADRVLVWLALAGLVFGGLATMAVAFSAERVLANLSAADAPSHGGGGAVGHENDGMAQDDGADHDEDEMGHDDDGADHNEDETGHDDDANHDEDETGHDDRSTGQDAARPMATSTGAEHDGGASHGDAPTP